MALARSDDAHPQRHGSHVDAAFAEEEYRGLRMAAVARLAIIAILIVWITIENGFPRVFFYYPFTVGFALIGVFPVLLRRKGRYRQWHRYLFPLCDVAVFTVMVLSPNPLEDNFYPATMRLRFGNELYLFIFLCAGLFSYSPRVVLWTGVIAALVWSAGTVSIYLQPGVWFDPSREGWQALSREEKLWTMVAPNRAYVGQWARLIVLLLLTSATLAFFVRRARSLVFREADAERQRANLSRYFSANMVDELAQSDQPLRETRSQPVAVVFADIVGFTQMSERQSPETVIRMLREFHERMQRAVFEQDGTLDKFIGDAVMATFGTPRVGPQDATSALRCVRRMVEFVSVWNRERSERGEEIVQVGIGAHYGPVVLGDIGGEQRLEFAVVGDTVNVASRLEHLTREMSVAAVVSGDLVDAAGRENLGADEALAIFSPAPPRRVRGREGDIAVWVCAR